MEQVLGVCIQGSAMALAVLSIRSLLVHRIPKWILPVLWFAVFARLALPLRLPVPGVLANAAGAAAGRIGALASQVGLIPAAGGDSAPSVLVRDGRDLPVLGAVWVCVAALCLLFVLSLCVRKNRLLRSASPCVDRNAERWLSAHRLRRPLRLLESSELGSPAAFGVARPSIVLPHGFLSGGVRAERVLDHELAHICRFDPAFKTFMLVVACLYWFDPVVWVAYRIACRDMELACDERALAHSDGAERKGYAGILIDMAGSKRGLSRGSLAFVRSPLEERVRAIVRPAAVRPRPATAALTAGLLGAVLLTGCATATLPTVADGRVDMGAYSFAIPDYWAGRVEVSTGESATVVYPSGHPELPLARFATVDSSSPLQEQVSRDYAMLWSLDLDDGTRVELWCLSYAGMSLGNLWALAGGANPAYPGEEAEREVVDLSTGGAVDAREQHGKTESEVTGFEFYLDEFIPGISVASR